MNPTVVTYLAYLLLSVALTIWVARTLFRNGQPFLDDAFGGEERLARSVNHLLVVGFYLINFGYITLNLKLRKEVLTAQEAIEALSIQVGLVLLVLGGMHFFNLFIFSRIRKRKHEVAMPPPVSPSERLMNMKGDYCEPNEGTVPDPA
ncbi:MAG: hypothetical protein KDD67_14620 [Ignavibacteriae bacterium]|nr:hypothetical protein [Ignavibacteriota bacterium]MCB9215157.1 hypothetical protein [Ignavibacteria bacterium]